MFDPCQVAGQFGGEGVASVEAEKNGEAVQGFVVFGQAVGLSIIYHLQSMFDPAQEFVTFAQFRRGLFSDAALPRQCVERVTGRLGA